MHRLSHVMKAQELTHIQPQARQISAARLPRSHRAKPSRSSAWRHRSRHFQICGGLPAPERFPIPLHCIARTTVMPQRAFRAAGCFHLAETRSSVFRERFPNNLNAHLCPPKGTRHSLVQFGIGYAGRSGAAGQAGLFTSRCRSGRGEVVSCHAGRGVRCGRGSGSHGHAIAPRPCCDYLLGSTANSLPLPACASGLRPAGTGRSGGTSPTIHTWVKAAIGSLASRAARCG